MPFTPFHMGLALVIKPLARRHFSVLTFGIAQVSMDLEPLLGMLKDSHPLHGWSHTLLGALAIGAAVGATAPFVLRPTMTFLCRKASHNGLDWLLDRRMPSRVAVWTGALFGTFSHVLLDGLIHHDMQPLAPFGSASPWLGLVEHDNLYSICATAGAAGAAAWVLLRWMQHRRANAER